MERSAQEFKGSPRKRETAAPRVRRRGGPAPAPAPAARVLVCDCDAAAPRPVGDEIRDLGYEVVALHTLADSLREATVTAFDTIVASVPTLTNEKLSLLKLLRRATPQVPLVIVTSDDSLTMRSRCQPIRPYYFAVRPLASEELREALRGALAHGASRR
jgi:DNA-binding response OmpR family regulator